MKYVNISRKDLENTLPIIATILGFMLDKRESEMAEIDTTVKSIAFSSDVSESDIMTLATIENRLTEVKFELMGIQALAKEVENTYYGLLFETKVYELNLPERTKSTLYRGGCSTMGQLVSLTPTQLKKIRNLGKKTYKDIVDMLKEYGLRLKDEDTTPTGGH
ncbi:MAG: DNA-directed RNA polymerase subunit alpha C-terminal domain-containing protein [Ruminiclostridium sp.]